MWLAKYKALFYAIVCKIEKAKQHTLTILPSLDVTLRTIDQAT